MYTNETANYDLPQYVESDTFNALSDLNPAFATIDRVMKENSVNAESAISLVENTAKNAQNAEMSANRALNNAQAAAISAKEAQESASSVMTPINTLTTRVSSLEQNAVNDENRITTLESTATTLESEIQDNQTDTATAQSTANAANTLASTAKTAADNALSVADSAVTMSTANTENIAKINKTIQFMRSFTGDGISVVLPDAVKTVLEGGAGPCLVELANSNDGYIIGNMLVSIPQSGDANYVRRFLMAGNTTAQYTLHFNVAEIVQASLVASNWTTISPDINVTFMIPPRWE